VAAFDPLRSVLRERYLKAVSYLGFFVAFGALWTPLALVLLTEAEGRRSPRKILLSCGLGWIASFAMFVGVGALGG
jgi:hypothetical protein